VRQSKSANCSDIATNPGNPPSHSLKIAIADFINLSEQVAPSQEAMALLPQANPKLLALPSSSRALLFLQAQPST
jgi:hypothetical protein